PRRVRRLRSRRHGRAGALYLLRGGHGGTSGLAVGLLAIRSRFCAVSYRRRPVGDTPCRRIDAARRAWPNTETRGLQQPADNAVERARLIVADEAPGALP